jgi:hypothetical protein
MSTTKRQIRDWLLSGRMKGATHVIVVCDTFDWEDYPVNVLPGQDVREVAKQYDGDMQLVMEVYNLSLSIEDQLAELRSMHYD